MIPRNMNLTDGRASGVLYSLTVLNPLTCNNNKKKYLEQTPQLKQQGKTMASVIVSRRVFTSSIELGWALMGEWSPYPTAGTLMTDDLRTVKTLPSKWQQLFNKMAAWYYQ